jgi:bifunctional enzyme CysN/CysC
VSGAETTTTDRPKLRLVVVGHVGHGKSTLVGRLIHDTGALLEGKLAQIEMSSRKRGMPFEWAFLLDALQAERDQGITIDTTQVRFRTVARDYIVIDAPGHHEFLKNMVIGAARADAAVLVVDAHEGIREQTRRHAYILRLLGLHRVIAVINKIDLVGFDRARYGSIQKGLTEYLERIGVPSGEVPMIPVSARDGDNIVSYSTRTPWYQGPTVVEALDTLPQSLPATELPLRLAVQDVYKFDDRRIVAGRIESGRLSVGDEIIFSPSGRSARIASIEAWQVPRSLFMAAAGQSVGITLDDQIFVERGQIASHASDSPMLTSVFRACLLWLAGHVLAVGARVTVKLLTAQFEATVERVESAIDPQDLSTQSSDRIDHGEVGEIVLRTRSLVALDEFRANQRTGRFVIVDQFRIVGGGIVSMEGYPDHRRVVRATNVKPVEHRVALAERCRQNGHRSGILWLTGLSGSGKSTLAMELERVLFSKGMHVTALDGDNLRSGLNSDLGFSPAERVENIRRVGEVAALMAQAGFLCITAFISPYRADRDRIRQTYPDLFHEVYLDASVEECERRDAKGLYARARRGEIKDFTGVSAPYEPPAEPELTIPTGREVVEQSLSRLVAYVERTFRLSSDCLD